MNDQIHLQIVTADGVVYDGRCGYVELPLEGGSIGVLPDHAPTMGAVTDGVLKCRTADGEVIAAVGQGVVNISHNEIILLDRSAELAENIDAERAHASETRARERLADKSGNWDMLRAEASLHRALARQTAARLNGRL